MSKRDSFIFYRSFYEAIKALETEDRASLYDAIFEYAFNHEELGELMGIRKAVFTLIKPQLDANWVRYEKGLANGKKGAEFGNKGGRPKADEEKETPKKPLRNPQLTPKKPSNVNDNDNENENENENEFNTPHAVAKATTPQADFVNQFSKIYNAKTGQMFKAGKEDYILIANMLKQFGLEVVASKLRTLSELCENQSVWFTKDGFSSFTIKKLSQFWNEIIPKESEVEKSDRIVREMVAERMRERNERA